MAPDLTVLCCGNVVDCGHGRQRCRQCGLQGLGAAAGLYRGTPISPPEPRWAGRPGAGHSVGVADVAGASWSNVRLAGDTPRTRQCDGRH